MWLALSGQCKQWVSFHRITWLETANKNIWKDFFFWASSLAGGQGGALISNLLGCLERFSLGSDGSISILIVFMHLAGIYLLHLPFPAPPKLLGLSTTFSYVLWEAKALNMPNLIKKNNWQGNKSYLFSQLRETLENELTAWRQTGEHTEEKALLSLPQAGSILGSSCHLRFQSQPTLGWCWIKQSCFSSSADCKHKQSVRCCWVSYLRIIES